MVVKDIVIVVMIKVTTEAVFELIKVSIKVVVMIVDMRRRTRIGRNCAQFSVSC